jgi:hypothetical protein
LDKLKWDLQNSLDRHSLEEHRFGGPQAKAGLSPAVARQAS